MFLDLFEKFEKYFTIKVYYIISSSSSKKMCKSDQTECD